MSTTMWILLSTGASVLVGTGLTLFTRSLFSYGQWRNKLSLDDLADRKAARQEAAVIIADFIRHPHTHEELDAALANYALAAEALVAVKQFLRAQHKVVDGTAGDYTDLFAEVREILVKYDQRLQEALCSE